MKKILLLKFILLSSLIVSAQCFDTLIFSGLHTVAQKSDGTLWGWGQSGGQLLQTPFNTLDTPTQLSTSETSWDKIFLGTQNTFLVKNDGTLWVSGNNTHGALGINSTINYITVLQQVGTDNNWIKISASLSHTLALKADGTIWAWGLNNNYQVGNAPASLGQLTPIQVGTDTNWIDIDAGSSSTSFALKSDGTIWGWGSNTSYLLVLGSSTYNVSSPTQIGTATDWKSMSLGAQHILAQKTDSTLWSWGGGVGRGIGAIPATTTPHQISTDKWICFSAGSVNKSFGIKYDGTLWTWGENLNGQLGDGTTTDHYVPIQIGTDTNWRSVKAGNGSSITMATKTDGSVWYWGGRNYYGTYGNGNSYGNTYIITPTQTQGICVTPTTTGPTYTNSTIGAVSGINPDGTAVSVGDNVSLTGVVHCQNFSIAGYDLTMIDSNNDGINLFSLVDVNGYIPTEGDEIKVDGEIEQFNGLIRINPVSITVLQQGAALQTPTLKTVLDESTESQFVRLENLELVNGETMWPTNGNIEVSNTVDTFTVRITDVSVLAGTPTPLINFHLTGIGKQDDASSPFDSGYQIYPCSVDPFCNIDNSTSLNNETISVNDTGLSYQWIDCADSSFIAGETGESFTALTDGNYAVIITQGPCVDTSACVFVDVLGLEGNELGELFNIYPNPAKDMITVQYDLSTSNAILEIFEISGRSISKNNLTSNKDKISLNTSKFQAGVYIVVVRQSNGNTWQQKLIIE